MFRTTDEVNNTLLELIDPFIDKLGIEKNEKVKDMCYNFVKDNFILLVGRNILKLELFNDLDKLCNNFKNQLMNLPEIESISIGRLNLAIKNDLKKTLIDLNQIYTKKYYTFNISIDRYNDETIEIMSNQDGLLPATPTCEFKSKGLAFRKLVSDIIIELNNSVFINCTKTTKFTISNDLDSINAKTIDIEFNLKEMCDIVKGYTDIIDKKCKNINKNIFNPNIESIKGRPHQKSINIPYIAFPSYASGNITNDCTITTNNTNTTTTIYTDDDDDEFGGGFKLL
jgi:hypothetical protein